MPKTAELTEEQRAAADAVARWWHDEPCRQTFALAGYAGTGKTTMLYHVVESFDDRVVVAAPTGKAALRLREKGVEACTIHQLAYRYEGTDEAGDPLFTFRGLSGGQALVVIDEASMVNQSVHDDLVGKGYRMLFVGDHGQLPPVGGDPGIMREPDFVLEEVHRQDDEGLLGFAHALRGGELQPHASGAVRAISPRPTEYTDVIGRQVEESDVVLCHRNQTRHWLNLLALRSRRLTDRMKLKSAEVPALLDSLVGKRVTLVCLRNDYKHGVYNGQVAGFVVGKRSDRSLLGELVADDGRTHEVMLDAESFLSSRGFQPAPGHLSFDFGYALTVHKAQGSEWPRVAVVDDYVVYRGEHDAAEKRARWAYTAATRAQDALTWIYT